GYAIHQFDAEQRAALEPFLLRAIQCVVFGDEVMRCQQEAASPTRRITDRLARLWRNSIHDSGNERARRKVLARAAFHVLGVLLQQPLVSVALYVGGEARPLF